MGEDVGGCGSMRNVDRRRGMGILNVAGALGIWGVVPLRALPLPPCRCARLETHFHLPKPGRGPLSDAILQTVYIQGTQVPSTRSQSSPVITRQRRPPTISCVLSRIPFTSCTCARLLRQHTHLSLFIVSASQPAASGQPASPKIPVSVTRKRQDNKPCLNTTHRDGILSDCHRGPAQEAKTLFFGAPSPKPCLVLLSRTGPRRQPAATRSSSRRPASYSTILSSTREPVTTVGPALTHPTPLFASRLESPLQPESSTRPGRRQVHNNSSNPTTTVTLSIRTEAEPTICRTRC